MSQYRIDRLQEEIRHIVGSILMFEISDPQVRGITLTRAVLTRDLSVVRIYYDTSTPQKQRKELEKGLDRAKGFIRKQLASRLGLKSVPALEFFYDQSKDEIARVEDLFSKI